MEITRSEDMYEFHIPLLMRNDSVYFIHENIIRGYHLYMKVWSPLLVIVCLVRKNKVTDFIRM